MNTCETCRFWNRNGDAYEMWDPSADDGDGDMVETPHRTCFRIIHGNGSVRYEVGGVAVVSAEPAFVTDGSGYAAALRTLPTFGCKAWEEVE